MNNSSGFNGAVSGLGQGVAQVGMLLMEDNLQQHREQRLAALKQKADTANYERTRSDQKEDYTKELGDKRTDAETKHGYDKALLQTQAAAEGKLDQMSNADREKARLKAIDKMNNDARTDSQDGMPWSKDQFKESRAAIEELYGPRTASPSAVDPGRVSAAAQAIQNKLAGNKGKDAGPGLIDGAEQSQSKPEEKGLIDDMVTGKPGNRAEAPKDELTRLKATLKAGGGGRSQAEIQKIKDRMAELEPEISGGEISAKLAQASKMITAANGDIIDRSGKVFMTAAEKAAAEAKVVAMKK